MKIRVDFSSSMSNPICSMFLHALCFSYSYFIPFQLFLVKNSVKLLIIFDFIFILSFHYFHVLLLSFLNFLFFMLPFHGRNSRIGTTTETNLTTLIKTQLRYQTIKIKNKCRKPFAIIMKLAFQFQHKKRERDRKGYKSMSNLQQEQWQEEVIRKKTRPKRGIQKEFTRKKKEPVQSLVPRFSFDQLKASFYQNPSQISPQNKN